jgi:hypothetical protein
MKVDGHTFTVKGWHNKKRTKLYYTIIHSEGKRVYCLDLGERHRQPDESLVAGIHKHRWTDEYEDQFAYIPDDITCPITDPVGVWQEFCAEAKIQHRGTLAHPFTQGTIQ